MSREKLEAYLRNEGVNAKVLMFKKHTMTVEDAERQLGIGRERIIKSMLFVDEFINELMSPSGKRGWSTCPLCGARVKSKNLHEHLARVHQNRQSSE